MLHSRPRIRRKTEYSPFEESRFSRHQKIRHELYQNFLRPARGELVKRKGVNQEDDKFKDYPTLRRVFDRSLGLPYNIFWGSALITCFCLCTYQIQDRLHMFLDAPILTSVKIIKKEMVKYPDITICGTVYGPSTNTSALFQKYYQQLNLSTPCDVYVWGLLENTEVNISEIWQASDIANDLHVNCSFEESSKSKGCIVSKVLTSEGTCVTYSVPNPVQFSAINSFIITGEPANISVQCKSDLKVLVHAEKFAPQLKSMLTDGKVASFTKGQNLQLLLTVKKFSYLNVPPHNPCVNLQKRQACLQRCLETTMLANLSCKLPYMRKSTLPYCTTINTSRLTLKKSQELLLKEHDACRCPRNCEEMVYGVNFVTSESKTRTRFKMEVIMTENVIDEVTESYTYGAVSLLCDIGGNLSLFLGTCLITVLELIELCLKNLKKGLQRLYE